MPVVIGADGFIGSRLLELGGGIGTTRRLERMRDGLQFLDLLDLQTLPVGDVYYLCAGANGAKRCEGLQHSFRQNVDTPIELANRLKHKFMVWISSMSIEWCDGAYQRQKLAAETVLRTMSHVGTVRAGRVTRDNIDDLCKTMLRVGQNRISGVTRWGTDDIAYQK